MHNEARSVGSISSSTENMLVVDGGDDFGNMKYHSSALGTSSNCLMTLLMMD